MRESSKLLPAALLTICLLLPGGLAASASGHTAGRAHHRPHHAPRSAARRHEARARHRRAASPKRVSPHAVRAPERPGAGAERRKALEKRKLSAASSAAATIASVLATPCQSTEVAPEPANIAAAREAVLCLVNRVRAEHSLAPLTANTHLQAAAEDHDAEMLQADYFAHVAPDGETPVERIRKTGYIASESVGYVIGENLAWGTYTLSTPKAIVEAWVASPGHLANILESRYTETGIAIAPAVPASLGEGNPGATYAQEFGVIVE